MGLKPISIIILVIEFLLIITIIVLAVIYGLQSRNKVQPSIIVPYPYGPTMFFARTEFPFLDRTSTPFFFPGLTYVPDFKNDWGTSQMDLDHPRLNSVSSNSILSTSSWVGKSLYVQRRWNGTTNTYTKVRLCTGLISIDTNTPMDSIYKDKLYLFGYSIPYSGFLKTDGFPKLVDGCFNDNKYNSQGGYTYREPIIDTTIVGVFCSPVLANSRTQPSAGQAVIPLQPDQVTFSIISTSGSEFTSTFSYVNNSDPTNYIRITLSKLVPYLYIEFSGIVVINAQAGDLSVNQGFEANPTAKVFNFYDGQGYIQPTGEVDKQGGVSRFTFSNGSLVSTYVSTSPGVAVYTRRGVEGTLAERTFCLVKSLNQQGATKMIIGPQSYAVASMNLPPQIPSTNLADNIVLINPDIFPSADNAVKSIKCSGLTLSSDTFTLNYEAELSASSTSSGREGGFLFVPYIGMLKGTFEGAEPVEVNTSIYSMNICYTSLYKTTSTSGENKFSVRYSYTDIPDYDYPSVSERVSELEEALSADWIEGTGIVRPMIFNADKNLCDDIYSFGKKIFNVAQCAWIAKKIGATANYDNFFNLLEMDLHTFISLRLPSGIKVNDPPSYPMPGENSNVRLTFGYTPDMKQMGVMDGDPGGSFGNRFGNDHIIHNGYIIFAIYLYLTMKNSTEEDELFRPFILALMRDVAQPYPDDSFFPRMKHFDFAQGVSWLAGVTDEANTESCSEVINGYYACYLMAKRFGDSRLAQFYKAILTLEISVNQEIRFFGIEGHGTLNPKNNLLRLLQRNEELWNTFSIHFTPPPDGVSPYEYAKLGIVIQNSYQNLSFNTLFGANAFPDVVFIIFLPFTPITTTWWTKAIGEFVANKTNSALEATYVYYNNSVTTPPVITENDTNILIISGYSSDGSQYIIHPGPGSLAFPPPMIGSNFEYAMQFMAYSYFSNIDAYLSDNLVESGTACTSVPNNSNLNAAFVNEVFYTGIILDNGTSNTLLRTSMLAIRDTVA